MARQPLQTAAAVRLHQSRSERSAIFPALPPLPSLDQPTISPEHSSRQGLLTSRVRESNRTKSHEADQRAKYGKEVIPALGRQLESEFGRGFGEKNLRRMVQFAEVYPDGQIVAAVLRQLGQPHFTIVRSLPAQSRVLLAESTGLPEIVRTPSAQSPDAPDTPVGSLSYSHFELLVGLDDDLKRRFYEREAVRGQWSVRELRRQIATLAFERTGLSSDKARLLHQIQQGAEADNPALIIRRRVQARVPGTSQHLRQLVSQA